MKPVTIYTRAFCPYCTRAMALLQRKGASVTEIDASDPDRRQEMIQRSGRWTFPQIFVGETHVGGCDDLHALEQRGALDPLLTSP
ncbi:glutaredoxin 3 [Terricaulis sp.]|uniref:glutaredoxin 3 n=1 Tax=Terricaulis sp. TaxID=2768686 RepID=UPI002AC7D49E|nr:glutaredoxin 3 [Terricaulis sp.]MDZ4693211.1 glutaredoxin 3 [Terricaulis sp.]